MHQHLEPANSHMFIEGSKQYSDSAFNEAISCTYQLLKFSLYFPVHRSNLYIPPSGHTQDRDHVAHAAGGLVLDPGTVAVTDLDPVHLVAIAGQPHLLKDDPVPILAPLAGSCVFS